jgi:hypothetical protein
MRFSAYFVRVLHPQTSFSGNLQLGAEEIQANFKRIAGELFAVHFKNQVELGFLQKISFKNSKNTVCVLLPVLSQYNQRKLKKIGDLLNKIEKQSFSQIILALLTVEKFLEVGNLLSFFKVEKWAAMAVATDMEIARQIKVINYSDLFVTSWFHHSQSMAVLENTLKNAYDSREKTLKFSFLEKALKVPQSTLYFKYLLQKCGQAFPVKAVPGAVMFSQLPLAPDEKARMGEMAKALKANKFMIFTIENIQKITSFSPKQINDALWYSVQEEKFMQLNERYFIFSDEYGKVINRLKKFKRNQGDIISIDDLRNLTSLTRKYLIVLFEYLDGQNITQRFGNKRRIMLGV